MNPSATSLEPLHQSTCTHPQRRYVGVYKPILKMRPHLFEIEQIRKAGMDVDYISKGRYLASCSPSRFAKQRSGYLQFLFESIESMLYIFPATVHDLFS